MQDNCCPQLRTFMSAVFGSVFCRFWWPKASFIIETFRLSQGFSTKRFAQKPKYNKDREARGRSRLAEAARFLASPAPLRLCPSVACVCMWVAFVCMWQWIFNFFSTVAIDLSSWNYAFERVRAMVIWDILDSHKKVLICVLILICLYLLWRTWDTFQLHAH